MKVTSIELWSNLDYTTGATNKMHVSLSLSQVSYTDSYLIKSVSGLDNAEIVPNYYGTGTGLVLGYQYYSMVPPPRVVSFLIKLNPQPGRDPEETVGTLRDELTKMISYTRRGTIEIKFKNGSAHVASLFGLVTKFESSIFTSESEVQITFTCSYPFLKGPGFTELISGTPAATSTFAINDTLSTAPHGVRMELEFTANVNASSPFTIQGISGQTVAPFIVRYDFKSFTASGKKTLDTLYINSESENKSIYVVRTVTVVSTGLLDTTVSPNPATTYLADKLDANSIWPVIFPGANSLGFSTTSFKWISVKYKTLYWGI